MTQTLIAALFLLALLTGGVGIALFAHAATVMPQLAALLCGVMATVCLSGALVALAIGQAATRILGALRPSVADLDRPGEPANLFFR